MKISQKLPLLFLALVLWTACAGLFAIYKLNASNQKYASIIEVDYANERLMGMTLVRFKTQVQEWKNTLLRGKDPAALDKYWNSFQKSEKEVREHAQKLQAALADGESKALVTQFIEAHIKMGEGYRKGFTAFKEAEFDSKVGDASVKGMDRAPAELLEKAQKKIVDDAQADTLLLRDQSKFASSISIGFMALAIVVGVLFGIHFSRKIVEPLDGAVQMAQAVASGDLTGRIVSDGSDETAVLLRSLSDMNDSLSKIVSEVRDSTDAIATSSSEIVSGSNDLAHRSASQTEALRRTSDSIEQLFHTVKQNADNASQANRLAESASEVAVKGGTVVTQVVDTMGTINQSSKKIVDIIGVIDGIAFQTNILALNAAVEAARAGEQGRGFAVVASEVRNLAQRSAAAAKEIKTLIGDSVDKVEEGARLVDQAGATMQEIVASIQRVTDIMGEISAVSHAQTSGIEEVNVAIAQIDQNTQQDASLVEETNAAANGLMERADNLSQLVSRFRLGTSVRSA